MSISMNRLFSAMAKCQNVEVLNFVSFCLYSSGSGFSADVWLKIRFTEAFQLLEIEEGICLADAAEKVFPKEGDDSLECEQFHAYVRDFFRQ